MQKIVLPQLAWYGPRELVLDLPDSWDIEICNIAGYNRPALSSDQIQEAIAKPIDRPPLGELARGKKEYDKRETIKRKDAQRQLERLHKIK